MAGLHRRLQPVLLPTTPPAACRAPASRRPHHKPLSSASQSGFDGDPAARYRCFNSSSRPVLHGKQQEGPRRSQQEQRKRLGGHEPKCGRRLGGCMQPGNPRAARQQQPIPPLEVSLSRRSLCGHAV